MREEETLLKFPCLFPVKIFGKNTNEFKEIVFAIFQKHVSDFNENCIRSNKSKDENYLAITVTINAESQAQLDLIYTDLSNCELVMMAL
jgi:putative lipoic acid-binding regulatory protein